MEIKFIKKMLVMAFIIITAVVGTAGNFVFAAETGLIRSINAGNLDTLDPNSKWNQVPDAIPKWSKLNDPNATLKEHLASVLADDLFVIPDDAMVWEFSAQEFAGADGEPGAKDWCLDHEKGSITNKAFLEEFKDNRISNDTNE